MADSFFTSRNQFDEQALHWPAWLAEEVAHAAARRLIKLEGPVETSIRLQRVADLCATANLMPIEHWQQLAAPAKAPRPAPWWRRLVVGPFSLWSYMLGLVVGSASLWWPW